MNGERFVVTDEDVRVGAAAIANERGGRRGVPDIVNVLDLLPEKLRTEVMEDARAALNAVAVARALRS